MPCQAGATPRPDADADFSTRSARSKRQRALRSLETTKGSAANTRQDKRQLRVVGTTKGAARRWNDKGRCVRFTQLSLRPRPQAERRSLARGPAVSLAVRRPQAAADADFSTRSARSKRQRALRSLETTKGSAANTRQDKRQLRVVGTTKGAARRWNDKGRCVRFTQLSLRPRPQAERRSLARGPAVSLAVRRPQAAADADFSTRSARSK